MSAVFGLILRREFNVLDKLLLTISMVCGVAYLVTGSLQPFPGSVVIKALSMAPLAILAVRVLKTLDGLILGISLVFSCIGDVLLGLRGANLFIFGLLSFLVAHLFYVWLFTRNFPRPFRIYREQQIIVFLILLFGAGMSFWLWSGFGDMKIPAMVYLCVITLMCVTATLMNLPKRTVVIGAILFLLSDSLIAANKFKTSIPFSHYAIWLTYYLGQCFIVLGFLREKLRA